MITEQQKNTLIGIQAALEDQFQGTGIDILFLASPNNRGVFGGTIEGLACMFALNMVKYKEFDMIIKISEAMVSKHRKELEEFVKNNKPSHEIINRFGREIEDGIIKK